jgi:hypothetical protein
MELKKKRNWKPHRKKMKTVLKIKPKKTKTWAESQTERKRKPNRKSKWKKVTKNEQIKMSNPWQKNYHTSNVVMVQRYNSRHPWFNLAAADHRSGQSIVATTRWPPLNGVAVSLNAGGDRLRQPASWCAGWIFGGNWRQTRAIQWALKIGQVRLYALHGGFSETTKSSNWFESRGLKYIHKHRGDNLPPLVLRDHHNMPLWHIWEFARDITWMWLESCA